MKKLQILMYNSFASFLFMIFSKFSEVIAELEFKEVNLGD